MGQGGDGLGGSPWQTERVSTRTSLLGSCISACICVHLRLNTFFLLTRSGPELGGKGTSSADFAKRVIAFGKAQLRGNLPTGCWLARFADFTPRATEIDTESHRGTVCSTACGGPTGWCCLPAAPVSGGENPRINGAGSKWGKGASRVPTAGGALAPTRVGARLARHDRRGPEGVLIRLGSRLSGAPGTCQTRGQTRRRS